MAVVGMPAFTDPNRPEAAGGSVNYELDEHPVKHAKSYGRGAEARLADDSGDTGDDYVETDEDRLDWTKKDWRAQAEAYELPVGGTLAELRDRVKEYEESDN